MGEELAVLLACDSSLLSKVKRSHGENAGASEFVANLLFDAHRIPCKNFAFDPCKPFDAHYKCIDSISRLAHQNASNKRFQRIGLVSAIGARLKNRW
jgi:hypothetical protein